MLQLRSAWMIAWRGLRPNRRGNAVMVATLALLAAVLIALLSLGYNLLVAPWTYDSDRFGVLRHGVAGSGAERYGFAPDEFRTLREAELFEALVASQRVPVALGDGSGVASPRVLVRTTADALAVTDAQPLIGRFVRPGDLGGERRLVLSHDLWRSQFGHRPDILGQTLQLDGETYEIVGVMPRRFHFMGGDVWTAHGSDPLTDTSTATNLVLNFKLRAGLGFDEAASRLEAITAAVVAGGEPGRYPRGWRITPLRVIDAVVGPQRPAVYLVLAGALALLLLGALNVAALLVARQIADTGTIATRKALGESRTLGITAIFLESLLITAAALLAALPIGRLLFDPLVGMIALEWVPRELFGAFAYVTPALWTLPLAAVAIAAVLTVIRMPGWLKIHPGATLGAATRTGARRGEVGASRWLSGVQVAIAALVLVSSLAIGAGARALMSRDMGFEPTALQHATLVFPRERYGTGGQRLAALDRMAAQLRRDGATAVGFTEAAPMQRYTRTGTLAAASGVVLDEPVAIDHHLVHGELGTALALRLHEGRLLDARLDRADTEPVAVITRALAERLAPNASALDVTVTAAGGNATPVPRRVVGVVDDIRHDSPLAQSRPTIYVPYAQDATASAAAGGSIAMLVRWPGAAAAGSAGAGVPSAARIEAAIASVDPWIAAQDITSVTVRAERSVAGITLARQLFAGFALLGVLLASLGIAAVAELAVARQRHEIAVRIALGASAPRVLAGVLGGGLKVAVPAVLAGTVLAWLLIGTLGAAVQNSATIGVGQSLLAAAALLACAILATVLPARRAARIQPSMLLNGG
jgi:predicted permease